MLIMAIKTLERIKEEVEMLKRIRGSMMTDC